MPTKSARQHAAVLAMDPQSISSISSIFQEVQLTVHNHRKNYVTLHKIHLEAADVVEETIKGDRPVGEKQFREAFMDSILRVMSLKKGIAAADCVLKFVGGYVKFMNEKAIEERQNKAPEEEEDEEDDNDEGTTASRFTRFLLLRLLEGCTAKDKNARYRVLYTIMEMITHLGTIDEDTYNALLVALTGRIHDREPSIRSIAAICLAKLAASDDSSETEDEWMIMDELLEALAFDTSAEVRRATLMNIPLNDRTLPAVLDRTLDTDQNIRKLVYGHILDKKMLDEERSIGLTHPKRLSISQREIIVKNGLGDRDSTVKAAASLLVAKWMDVININAKEPDIKPESDAQESVEDKLVNFISLFDLNTGLAVACDALQSIFRARPDIFKKIEFDDKFWSTLGSKKAFLARVFVEHCTATKNEAKLEATLPVVTAITFRIFEAYNQFADSQRTYDAFIESKVVDEGESNRKENDTFEKELCLTELLKLAVILDYSDETGRRNMFNLVRKMLSSEILPEAVTGACLDVLRELSTERDLIRLVVEIVQELRYNIINGDQAETEEPEEDNQEGPNPSAILPPTLPNITPEQQSRLNITDAKCLTMCIGMLERVNGTFEENSTLDGVLKDLILPSFSKQDDEILHERGTKALALCCLIARRLAIQTFKQFINMIPSSPPHIRLILAQALFDIFMVHRDVIFKDEINLKMITMFLLTQVRNEQVPEVQAILCQGTAKLVMARIITDIEAVKTLLKAYISPLTKNNTALRQALNVFFDLYSLHSLPENQQRMREIFILMFLDLCEDRRNVVVDDDDNAVLESVKITSMFLGWTNPLQVFNAIAEDSRDGKLANECIHLDMARDIITLLFEKDLKIDIEKEDKRVLCQLLNKLYIPDTVDDYRIRSLKLLMTNLGTRRPLRDSVCKKAFAKFEATITKIFEKQLEDFSEEEFRKLEELEELFMFLDSVIPLDDEESESDIPQRSRKRRSESIISTATESRSNSHAARRKNKPKNKRPRLSTSGEDEEEDEEDATELGTPKPPPAPTRTVPKRAAARKPIIIEPIMVSSDSDEWQEPGPSSRTDKGKPGSRARYRPSVKQEFEETQVEGEFDSILDNNSSTSSGVQDDSIMGPDDSEEEEEVNDLLVED